ncbi:MAG TPA: C40 family peptidase [Clostridiales bacterium]|jgi:cell wall-associated NlpC family hydrolase|nr:C40 family peptidase [Clostridiales bacterium]HQP69885.1 C40 family peptidase [Clostridiales bacterium]
MKFIKYALLFSAVMLLISCSSSKALSERDKQLRKEGFKITESFEKFYEKYKKADYKIGATGPDEFDCSGFVQLAYKEVYGIKLHRSSQSQFLQGAPVKDKGDLKYGDLVFFNTNGKGVSHVGIYLYDRKFLHASTTKGPEINLLTTDYYKDRYIEGRRIQK